MSTENSSNEVPSAHLPLALIAVTILIILVSQVGSYKQSAKFIEWQKDNAEKQIAQLQAVNKQASDAIEARKTVVKQADDIQGGFQSLLTDLLELKDDKEADTIVKKWNIQRNQPAAGAGAAAAPAAGAAPAAPAPAAK